VYVFVEQMLIQQEKIVVAGQGKMVLKPNLLEPGCEIASNTAGARQ